MDLRNRLLGFVRDEEGQDLIEYALLVALISIVAVLAMTRAGTAISGVFTNIATRLEAAV